MPSAKSGNAGSPVAPADPKKAEAADKADPGEVDKAKAEQQKTQTGKYGTLPIKPYKKPTDPEAKKKKTSWIEIAMVDEEGGPVVGEKYRVTLPDGRRVYAGSNDGLPTQ